MLKTVREPLTNPTIHQPANWLANDARGSVAMGRSVFPEDAVARIFKPSRCVITAGHARCKGWRLVFERRSAPAIGPLMGWIADSDTLTQIELNFPTLDAAIRYAERQGLAYVVQPAARCQERLPPSHGVRPAGRAPLLDLGHFSRPERRARARPPRNSAPSNVTNR